MTNGVDDLAIRKDLLLAQSALYRAQLKYEAVAFRARLTSGTNWISRVTVLFSVARTVYSLVSLFRK